MAIAFQDATKREIWETVRKLNDSWTKGNGKELINYFHKNMVAVTPTDRNRLEGQAACVASWSGFASAAKIHYWEEIDPKIELYGNTAVITYYFDMSFDMGGQTTKMGGRDMLVFIKEGGKWLAIADQFSPYPN